MTARHAFPEPAPALAEQLDHVLASVLHRCPRLVVDLPGPPRPKERPRAYVDDAGRARVRTPKATKGYEGHVRRVAGLVALARGWPAGGWEAPGVRYVVRAEVVAESDLSDLDNVIKAAIDGLEGPVLPNDRRVLAVVAFKRVAGPAERPRATLTIWALGPTGEKQP
ncbi:MAG TPA: hypothetical protein VFS43_46720 [Polyangiaceae bacterium]|nr:hypothetical protein [Polyangiaceae bacterium]